MNRREFIAGAAGFGLLGSARTLAGDQTPPRLVFGVISDIHLKDARSCAKYARALRWFDAHAVDAVMCCGDLAFVGDAATPAVTRLAYSDRCARPESEDTIPVACPFAVEEFPVGVRVRFEVRARNAFGRCGAPLEVRT